MKINFEFLGRNGENVIKEVFFIRGPAMGEIIPCPFWIISLPVLIINFELIDKNEKHVVKKIGLRPGSRRNHSISCLDNSISCFENKF